MQPSVSFALIVRNEEAKLPACLESIAGIAGEIIVVDTGSTDRTKEVAAGFGAKVFDFPWIDDFAAARNEGIRHATGEWVFWLDADERIDEGNREKLRKLFQSLSFVPSPLSFADQGSPAMGQGLMTNDKGQRTNDKGPMTNAAFVMKCLCGDGGSGGTVVDHVRLFRNRPENRWKYRVHEQILPALKTTGTEIRWTDIVIHHLGYQDPALTRRKLERNLRLLHLDFAEHPDDPYILFHLGWANLELGNVPEAFPFLHKSLQLSHPADSIVKKIYALLVQAHSRLGQRQEALAACRAGRARCPGDPELLYLEGQLLRNTGQLDAAIATFRRLLSKQEMNHGEHGEHGEENHPRINTNRHEEDALRLTTHNSPLTPSFGSMEVGFTGYLARNQLAHLYYAKGMHAEAEAEWRKAVEERPDFLPAWLGLGELFLDQARLDELDQVVEKLNSLPSALSAVNESLLLKSRNHLARKEYDPARAILEELSAANPRWIYPRIILSHVLLQDGSDPGTAERILREIVDLDPSQVESWRNLAVLYRHQGKLAQAAGVCRSARAHCPHDLDLLLLEGILLGENGEFAEAESSLVAVISRAGQDAKGRQRGQEARHQLALLYIQAGRFNEAEGQWREVLAECPDHGLARQGLDSLQRQRKQKVLAAVS